MAPDQRALDAPAYGAAATTVLRLPAGRSVIALCGFVRDGTANFYTEPWRLEA